MLMKHSPAFSLNRSVSGTDKYSQIYRILLPITNALEQIPGLMEKPAIRSYIENEFGSEDKLYREILGDFFRHGFDGSGADNVSCHPRILMLATCSSGIESVIDGCFFPAAILVL